MIKHKSKNKRFLVAVILLILLVVVLPILIARGEARQVPYFLGQDFEQGVRLSNNLEIPSDVREIHWTDDREFVEKFESQTYAKIDYPRFYGSLRDYHGIGLTLNLNCKIGAFYIVEIIGDAPNSLTIFDTTKTEEFWGGSYLFKATRHSPSVVFYDYANPINFTMKIYEVPAVFSEASCIDYICSITEKEKEYSTADENSYIEIPLYKDRTYFIDFSFFDVEKGEVISPTNQKIDVSLSTFGGHYYTTDSFVEGSIIVTDTEFIRVKYFDYLYEYDRGGGIWYGTTMIFNITDGNNEDAFQVASEFNEMALADIYERFPEEKPPIEPEEPKPEPEEPSEPQAPVGSDEDKPSIDEPCERQPLQEEKLNWRQKFAKDWSEFWGNAGKWFKQAGQDTANFFKSLWNWLCGGAWGVEK